MNNKCSKCGKDANGSTFVEGGLTFKFCSICTDIINELDRTGNVIHDFIEEDKKESQIAKNMREARERRSNGLRLWK